MTQSELTTIRNEIINDPETQGYKNGSQWKADGNISALLNAKNSTMVKTVSPHNYNKWLAKRGIAKKLTDGLSNSNGVAASISKVLLDFFISPHLTSIDLGDSDIAGALDSLVSNTVITQADKDNFINTVATQSASRVEILLGEGRSATSTDVGKARHL